MSFEIKCPYCFLPMKDNEVFFRSEKVNQGEPDFLPDGYDDLYDFTARYRGQDKEAILQKCRDWEFFVESEDPEYVRFWSKFGGTTEVDLTEEFFHVKAFRRPIIDPNNPEHQKFLKKQPDGGYFIYDDENDKNRMVTQIELATGETCNRRVCRHCRNPLPDNYGKHSVKFVPIIGITNAGKTVYLSQLLKKMKTYAGKAGLDAIVGTTSVRRFIELNPVAQGVELPPPTPATRLQQPLFYDMVRNVEGRGRITDTIVLYDVAGEVFDEKKSDVNTIHNFARFVEHAHGIIVLLDPMSLHAVTESAASGETRGEATSVLSTIHHVIVPSTNEKCQTPLAICVSKIDTQNVQNVLDPELRSLLLEDVHGERDHRGFNKPVFNGVEYNQIADKMNEFIHTTEYDLSHTLWTNYENYAYFAFTALGCDVELGQRKKYPVGPVLPKRLEEPILWLFHKLGYIGTNAIIHYPNIEIVPCEICGCEDTSELPIDEQEIVSGWGPFKKRTYVNRICNACNHKWNHVTS